MSARNSTFFRTYFAGSFFIIFSLLSAAVNYSYYPVLARVLSQNDFGASQALISLLSQASSLFAGLSLVTVYLVIKHRSKAQSYAAVVQKIVMLIVVLVAAAIMLLSPFVGEFLHLSNILHVAMVLFALLTMVPFIIIFGFLVGHKRFVTAACFQFASVSAKLVIGGILAMNFGVTGALLGIGLGQLIAVIGIWLLSLQKRELLAGYKINNTFSLPTKKELKLLKPEYATVASLLVVSSCLVVYSSYDALVARNVLASENGLYASASTLGTIVLFGSLPLINLLMPYLNPKSLRLTIAPITRTVFLILAISCFVTAAFLIIPTFFLGIYGQSYLAIAPILWQFSTYMALVTVLTLALQLLAFYRPVTGALIAVGGVAGLIMAYGYIEPVASSVLAAPSKVFAIMLTVVIIILGYHYIYERNSKKTSFNRRPGL